MSYPSETIDSEVDVSSSEDPGGLDLETALERVGGDRELLGEIAGLFLEECPGLLAAIRDAVCAKDAPALQEAAHSLKGSVGNFGAKLSRESAFRLEMMGRGGDLAGAEEALDDLERAIAALTPQLEALAKG